MDQAQNEADFAAETRIMRWCDRAVKAATMAEVLLESTASPAEFLEDMRFREPELCQRLPSDLRSETDA